MPAAASNKNKKSRNKEGETTGRKAGKQTPSSSVCYTGARAKPSGVHTEAEFVSRVSSLCTGADPCPGDLRGWIEWSGAEVMPPAACRRLVARNRRINAANRAVDAAAAAFDGCVDRRCAGAMELFIASQPQPTARVIAMPVARCAAMRCAKASARLASAHTAAEKKTR
jgi:hypothetical protein